MRRKRRTTIIALLILLMGLSVATQGAWNRRWAPKARTTHVISLGDIYRPTLDPETLCHIEYYNSIADTYTVRWSCRMFGWMWTRLERGVNQAEIEQMVFVVNPYNL